MTTKTKLPPIKRYTMQERIDAAVLHVNEYGGDLLLRFPPYDYDNPRRDHAGALFLHIEAWQGNRSSAPGWVKPMGQATWWVRLLYQDSETAQRNLTLPRASEVLALVGFYPDVSEKEARCIAERMVQNWDDDHPHLHDETVPANSIPKRVADLEIAVAGLRALLSED